MNYKTSSQLEGNTLQMGDLVNLCSVGHSVNDCFSLDNLGGCQNAWVLAVLDVYNQEEFCQEVCGNEVSVFIDEDDCDFPEFQNFQDLTKVVLVLMKMSEDQNLSEE